ncbi:exodeoxyribonuclease VII large subunit [Ferviditalea candida]|uniref:Exodeoxyribonuclease 7 large subunit n=1 Tax=Ferviditalea candida TaxID=3108399 RepID=A0ABU5ZGS2_9BACL|nr:exodeoxyribonuclease VII large subunit [Paenibacillaceae bacterium T2]
MQNAKRILTVKELTRYIKMKMELDPILVDVWIRGELSNFTHHSSGHMYFTLKDEDSRIKCVMFASHNQRLPFLPKNGSKVLARGSLSVFERDGQYQLYVTQMQPDGIGSLYLAFEQLKQKLEREGLFSPHLKKPIPPFPKVIGVITSPTGAAVRDIMTTLQRRLPSVSILLFPVLVQGEQAASSIVRAIETMNRLKEADVLIVGRGGGSLEELWAFNEESVARSLFASEIPVISAVGHETDYTIADFVADLRAATPTAAAELAVPHHIELGQQLSSLSRRLYLGTMMQFQTKRERMTRLQRSQVFVQPRKYLMQPAQRVDRLREQLTYKIRGKLHAAVQLAAQAEHKLTSFNPRERLRSERRRLRAARHMFSQTVENVQKERKQQLLSRIRQLDALSPLKVMQRGYGLVYKAEALVKSIGQVETGDMLTVRLADGRAECEVRSLKGEGNIHGREE